MSNNLQFLTQDQIDQFHRDGYLLIPNFLSRDDIQEMMTRSKQLLEDFTLEGHPMTKFTTGDSTQDKHVGDDYFLNSGDKIRYFLEEDAVGPDGKLNRPKELAVNKIGHALHELDPTFRRITLQNERLKALAKDLQFHKDPEVLQSMLIFKQPEIGGKGMPRISLGLLPLGEHNDSTFLYTNPPSALGFWFALEDCTPTNGALSFLPGSHKTTQLKSRFVRLPQGGTGFEPLPNATEEAPASEPNEKNDKYIQPPCPAGTLVLIHGSVLHKSEKNTSSKTRYAYTFHMIESEPYAQYDEKNWLQPTKEMPFSKLFAVHA
ncbi:hypothetical protein FRC00_011224 [Tulasnella sp. 408]|nr:hypothetical protein FRC00_011224 [Tulasnella sp. 408]